MPCITSPDIEDWGQNCPKLKQSIFVLREMFIEHLEEYIKWICGEKINHNQSFNEFSETEAINLTKLARYFTAPERITQLARVLTELDWRFNEGHKAFHFHDACTVDSLHCHCYQKRHSFGIQQALEGDQRLSFRELVTPENWPALIRSL